MAGYSGTPLPKKLDIAEGSRVALVAAPKGFEQELEPLPPGARLSRRLGRGLPTGWVDNKVCAIDETWSGLRFVLRKENRPRSGK
jgi:hypothetical protein